MPNRSHRVCDMSSHPCNMKHKIICFFYPDSSLLDFDSSNFRPPALAFTAALHGTAGSVARNGPLSGVLVQCLTDLVHTSH